MRSIRIIGHIGFVLFLFFLFLGIPLLTNQEMLSLIFPDKKDVDAVTTASIDIPDVPEGEFWVLMKTELHDETLKEWESFFRNEDFPVIFEDLRCLVAAGDIKGKQLADRYAAQLPENQMVLREENATLLASKIESGYIDVAILSPEMAEYLKVQKEIPGITLLRVSASGSD